MGEEEETGSAARQPSSRDSPSFEVLDGGVSNPVPTVRAGVRRDREIDVYSRSPQDVPEWRKDSWRPGSSGSCGSVGIQQGLRRRAYDEEVESTLSTSYPPRPAANWGENGYVRSLDRSGVSSASGQGRWEHRLSTGDRDRERRLFEDLDSDELDSGNQSFGAPSTHARSRWVPSEGDGLLGSGGGGSRGALSSGLPGQPSRHSGSGRNNRSTDQYQAPKQSRVSSTSSNLRRDETDFINDETFGFDDSTTEERVEQERQRRESFESMRKLHHSQFKELKENCLPAELKPIKRNDENSLWDSQACMDAGAGSPSESPGRSESSTSALPTSVIRSQPSTHSSTPRPAVPPGFTKAVQSRTPPEAANRQHNMSSEAMDNNCRPHTKGANVASDLNTGGLEKAGSDLHGVYGGIEGASSQIFEMVNTSTATHQVSKPEVKSIPDGWNLHFDGGLVSETGELKNIGLEKYTNEGHNSGQNKLLVQLEGDDIVSVVTEDKISEVEDSWSSLELNVSTLDQCFHTKETPGETIPSMFPKAAKSISLSDTGAPQSSQLNQVVPFKSLQLKHQSPVLPMPAGLSLEDVEKGIAAVHMDDVSSRRFSPFGKVTLSTQVAEGKQSSEPPCPSGVLAAFHPVFLTCEDIELSIIAEADRRMDNHMSVVHVQPAAVQSSRDLMEPGSSTKDADGKASQHLMSLLRRPPSADQICRSRRTGEAREQVGGNEDLCKDDLVDWASGDYSQGKLRLQPKIAGEFPTLESLFGKAFMNELRAQDKPISMKNCSHQVQVGGGNMSQLPLAASSFRQSEPGSKFTSNPSVDSVGSILRQGVSDARDVLVTDLLARKPTILLSDQDIALASTHQEELWPSSFGLHEQGATGRILSGSSGIPMASNDTENENKTCSAQARDDILEKTSDSTHGVQNHTSPKEQAFPESTLAQASVVSMENLGNAPCLSRHAVTSASVLDTGRASSNRLGALGEGAKEHSVAIGRASLPMVDNRAFQDDGVVKSTFTSGVMFPVEKSFDGSAGEGLQDILSTKGRLKEVKPRPDRVAAGYFGGHHPQNRATGPSHFEGTAGQPHQNLGYSGFLQQPQAGLPMALLYRPLSPPVVGLHSHPTTVHHQLPQPLMSQGITPGGYTGFSHPPYRPPQPQQQVLPHFGGGGAMDFPHFGFGHTPDNRGRSFSQHASATGSSHFLPQQHLTQQGAYHHMRPIGPIPNQFIGAARVPQRGPFFQVMNRGPFIHDHSLHEPVSLAAKQGQPGSPIFSMNGPSLHSGPIHQPGHNGRAQPLGPHLSGHPSPLGFISGAHFVSDLGHASTGQELSSFPSNNGNAVGSSGMDRWFGMDANCNFPAKPGHGLIH